MAFGFEFAGTIVACIVAGNYVDRWLGSSPLFILVMTIAGMGGALYRLLWSLRRFHD